MMEMQWGDDFSWVSNGEKMREKDREVGVVGNGANVTSSIVVPVTSIVEGDVVKEKGRGKKK